MVLPATPTRKQDTMSFILNSYDIYDAQLRAAEDLHRPNLQKAVLTLARLSEWADNNSDGWAYWKKPAAAATKLQTLVQSFYFASFEKTREDDVTNAELKAAYTPIKTFLTKQQVAQSEIFING